MTWIVHNVTAVWSETFDDCSLLNRLFSITKHHLVIGTGSFRIFFVINPRKCIDHSIGDAQKVKGKVCHLLYTSKSFDHFSHEEVERPDSWCSADIIELLKYTFDWLAHFSNWNINGINTFQFIASIVDKSFYYWQAFFFKSAARKSVLNNTFIHQKMGFHGFVIAVSIKTTSHQPLLLDI